MLDVEITFRQFHNSFDHDFAAVNQIRFLKRIVLLKALANNYGQLGAAQNYLGAVLLFLQLLQQDNEVIDYFFTLVSGLDAVDYVLEEGLVFRAGSHWLNTASLQTLLEKTGVDATASSKDAALLLRPRGKDVLQDFVGADFDHADEWNIAAAFDDILLEGVGGVASADNKITLSPN